MQTWLGWSEAGQRVLSSTPVLRLAPPPQIPCQYPLRLSSGEFPATHSPSKPACLSWAPAPCFGPASFYTVSSSRGRPAVASGASAFALRRRAGGAVNAVISGRLWGRPQPLALSLRMPLRPSLSRSLKHLPDTASSALTVQNKKSGSSSLPPASRGESCGGVPSSPS